MTDVAQRMALGTVQLGMPYGIANKTGRPDEQVARRIVQEAWDGGVRFFDTAQSYGVSEVVLGRALTAAGALAEAKVISKLDPRQKTATYETLRDSLRGSLERIGLARLWGVLLHRETFLDDWQHGLGPSLLKARDRGLFERAGVSVYSVDRAKQALRTPGIGILQASASVFDRRMIRAGIFGLADRIGIKVFVRSVYLQGLALMEPDTVPANLDAARDAVARFAAFCARHGVSRGRFAVGYVLQRAPSAMVVVGAESYEQVRENMRFFAEPPLPAEMLDAWDAEWPDDDESFINPQSWSVP